MSTYLREVIEKQQDRISEISSIQQIILSYTREDQITNEALYNASCRAAIVLVAAHTEGFLEDTISAAITDINNYSNFSKAHFSMKYCMCLSILPEKEPGKCFSEGDVQELVRVFDTNNIKFEKQAFVSSTKNPNPSVVERLCKTMGLKGFFAILEDSEILNSVFESRSYNEVYDALKQEAILCSATFPYTVTSLLAFNTPNRSNKTYHSIWKTFLNDMIEKRNKTVHGTDLQNSISHHELLDMIMKTLIFQLCFLLCLCTHIGRIYDEQVI